MQNGAAAQLGIFQGLADFDAGLFAAAAALEGAGELPCVFLPKDFVIGGGGLLDKQRSKGSGLASKSDAILSVGVAADVKALEQVAEELELLPPTAPVGVPMDEIVLTVMIDAINGIHYELMLPLLDAEKPLAIGRVVSFRPSPESGEIIATGFGSCPVRVQIAQNGSALDEATAIPDGLCRWGHIFKNLPPGKYDIVARCLGDSATVTTSITVP